MRILALSPAAFLSRAPAPPDGLVGDHFTVADSNVACVLAPSRTAPLDMADHQPTLAWLARCYGRPAAVAARARFAG